VNQGDQAEFVSLFTDLVERAYISRMEQYSGEKINYVRGSVEPDGQFATVKTTLATKSGADVPMDYPSSGVVTAGWSTRLHRRRESGGQLPNAIRRGHSKRRPTRSWLDG
jgi:ABC-type transporter MlaC component